MMDMLIHDTINRGILTALSSAMTMILVSPSPLAPLALILSQVPGVAGHVLVFPWARPEQQAFVFRSFYLEPLLTLFLNVVYMNSMLVTYVHSDPRSNAR
jgi:hypothetical protein